MFLKKYLRIPARKLIFNRNYSFSVRVRYAPSPTGFMHIGGLRTALFNYLYAKKEKGQFIVRIQDTDRDREVEGSIQNIFQSLEWIEAVPDQSIKNQGSFGPYIQSQRIHLYKQIQKDLLKSNKAYPCFCKHDKKEKQAQVIHPYDGKCRSLTFAEIKQKILNKQQYAVRIKSDLIPCPKAFRDEVFGQIQFKPLDDFVIVRSNGWPTFHLANVVDDWKMGITHVMRGEEWLTNTNKHIYLYMLLGAPIPKFVHLPLIKDMNGKKLAKRDPSSAVKFFQTGKYEVQAVKCFLSQLGLNRASKQSNKQPANEEQIPQLALQKPAKKQKQKKQQQNLKLFSNSQMIEQFDISRITRVPVKFDIKQLDYLNKLVLKKRWNAAGKLKSEMEYFLNKTHEHIPSSKQYQEEYIKSFLAAIIERLNHITDLQSYKYYFEEPDYFSSESKEDIKKILGKEASIQQIQQNTQNLQFKAINCDESLLTKSKKIIHHLRLVIQHIIPPNQYSQLELLKKISQFLFQSPQLKNEDVYHLFRFAISGKKSGPNITLACQLIGRQKVIKRLSAFSTL